MDHDFSDDHKPNITEHVLTGCPQQGHWAAPSHDLALQGQNGDGASRLLKQSSRPKSTVNRFFTGKPAHQDNLGGILRSRISSHHPGEQIRTGRPTSQGFQFQPRAMAGATASPLYNTGRSDKHVLRDKALNSTHIPLGLHSHGAAGKGEANIPMFPRSSDFGQTGSPVVALRAVENSQSSLRGLATPSDIEGDRHPHVVHLSTSPSFQDRPRSPSKSSSVMKAEDLDVDLSALVASKFSQMKTLKSEVEEQRKTNAELHARISSVKNEYNCRIDAMKAAAKNAIDASNRSLKEMKDTMDGLKMQAKSSFNFATDIRSNLPAAEEIRETIKTSLERFESLFDDDGRLVQHAEMKDVVLKLQTECTKTRHANDLLHDKLTDLTSQLVEAKDRIRDLESLHLNNSGLLRTSADQITAANLTIATQGEALKSAQHELFDTLSGYADAQTKLETLEEKYAKLQVDVAENDKNAAILQDLRNENVRLQTLLEQKTTIADSLSTAKQELVVSAALASQQHAEINILKLALTDKEQAVEQLREQCGQLATRESVNQQTIAKYESDVEAIRSSERAAIEMKEQVLRMKSASDERVATLERELQIALEELRHHKEKAQQVTMQLQLLQQRFEDQSTTLQLTKEANGEVQERMIATEKASAAKLDRELGNLQRKVDLLDERNSSLKQALEDSKHESQRLKDHVSSVQTEHETRLKSERESGQSIVQDVQKRLLQAEEVRSQARRDAEDLSKQLLMARHEFEMFKERSQHATISSAGHVAEVDALKQQIQVLQSDKDELLIRTQTIGVRYKDGQLSDAEMECIDAILKESAALYEQKLADKQNQLRRKANVNDELSAKVTQLEKALARHLNSEALNKTAVQSIVNLDNFMSSERSHPMSQAPDSDVPSEKESPSSDARPGQPSKNAVHQAATSLVHARRQSASSPREQVLAAAAHHVVHDDILQPRTPKRPSGRGLFRRIASEASDDIVEFEDIDHDASGGPSHKRDRLSSPSKAEDVAHGSRPGKRPASMTVLSRAPYTDRSTSRRWATRRLIAERVKADKEQLRRCRIKPPSSDLAGRNNSVDLVSCLLRAALLS
ncbi:hypothetical protein EVG20_g4137 [Dentipellis fragilis]|uniref:Uncharacterized protein n=1 Tax=Dentipellis fragilis TaxID=205917 RepID=A0A4Y9YZB4_9AGAM|nr:hypothetical protein EVG20_g4137 [Dentipellis fragilis]